MNKTKFTQLLQLNRALSNKLYTMSDEEKKTVKGGKIFRKVHQTDLKIAVLVNKRAVFQSIVEKGEY